MRTILATSLLTGGFCAVFAGIVDVVTGALTMVEVMVLGAVSGASGSLLAQIVTGRRKGE